MLKLYYSPGACSLVPHIALDEAEAGFELTPVILLEGQHLTADYLAINPHARVPALATDQGVITENIAILNFIADEFQAPGSVPRGDHFSAAKCNELLGWFASTVHISFAQVWRASRFTDDEAVHPTIVEGGRANLARQFEEIESLCSDEWLAPGGFSAADGYALTFLRWAKRIGFDLANYPQWTALAGRALERPGVKRVVQREGLRADDFRA